MPVGLLRRYCKHVPFERGIFETECQCAGGKEYQERYPQTVIAEIWRQRRPSHQVDNETEQHHIAHIGGACRADKNAVELKTGKSQNGRERHPWQIKARRLAHFVVDGQLVDDEGTN